MGDLGGDEIDVHVGEVEALEHAESSDVEVILLHQQQSKQDQIRYELIREGRELEIGEGEGEKREEEGGVKEKVPSPGRSSSGRRKGNASTARP